MEIDHTTTQDRKAKTSYSTKQDYKTCRGYKAAGFTLTELTVAVAVLLILLGIASSIYKASSTAVQQNNSLLEIYQKADAIRQTMEEDIKSITKEGYLFLIRREFTNLSEKVGKDTVLEGFTARADRIVFWRTGKIRSFEDSSIWSNVAEVYYSHCNIVDDLRRYGESPEDGSIANHWILSRDVRLYRPSYYYSEPLPQDAKDLTLSEIIRALQRYFTNYSEAYITHTPELDSEDKLYLILAEGVGSFRIEFLLPTEDYDRDGLLDNDERDGYDNWPPDNDNNELDDNIWLDLPELGRRVSPPGYILPPDSDKGVVCFSPDSWLWPKAIRVTVHIYDKDLRIRKIDPEDGKEHAGISFKFIINMD